MKNKRLKITLIVLGIVLVILIAAGFFVGNFFFNLALNPHSDKSSVFNAEHNSMGSGDDGDDFSFYSEENQLWMEETGYEDIYLTSQDGLKLHAYQLVQKESTNRWAVVCHGYGSNGMQMARSARNWYEMGYNVLLHDARGSGESEGDYIGMGWHERKDIVGWIEGIVEGNPQAQVVLYGVSMGGGTVMMVSGEALPANVKAIVEDCGYTSVWDEFSYQLKEIFGIPSFPVMNFASLVTKIRAGFWLGEASAIDQVAKSVTPMLFIHGDSDTFVPSHMVYEVYEACQAEKELIIAEGAGHGMASAVMGDDYWHSVETFVNRYIE